MVIFMFKKYNWQQLIYKDDVINVILNGLIFSILAGILAGVIDYLFVRVLGLSISFGLIIMCYMIGNRMRKSYYNYHILYPVLSIVFMLLSLIFSEFAYMFCAFPQISTFKLFISGNFYYNVLISPIYYLLQCFKSFDIIYLIVGILDVVIYVLTFQICYKLVRGRN